MIRTPLARATSERVNEESVDRCDGTSRGGDVVLDDGRLVGRRGGHRRLRIQRQLDQRDVVDGLHAVVRVRGRAAGIAIRPLLLLLRREPRVRHLQQEQVLVHVVPDHVVINFRCNSVVRRGEEEKFSVKSSSCFLGIKLEVADASGRSFRHSLKKQCELKDFLSLATHSFLAAIENKKALKAKKSYLRSWKLSFSTKTSLLLELFNCTIENSAFEAFQKRKTSRPSEKQILKRNK